MRRTWGNHGSFGAGEKDNQKDNQLQQKVKDLLRTEFRDRFFSESV